MKVTGRLISCLISLCLLGPLLALPAEAAEQTPRQKQFNNQADACKSKKDYGCAKICLVAAKNPEKPDLGEKCDQSYRATIPASSQSATPQPKEPRLILRDQARFCAIHKDQPCVQACATATKNFDDAAAVQQCNGEYQRVLAANPPPPPRPEESMTLAERIARMPEKLAWCQEKKAVHKEAYLFRSIDACVKGCGDKRVTDMKYPEDRRTSLVTQCEVSYYGLIDRLGN